MFKESPTLGWSRRRAHTNLSLNSRCWQKPAPIGSMNPTARSAWPDSRNLGMPSESLRRSIATFGAIFPNRCIRRGINVTCAISVEYRLNRRSEVIGSKTTCRSRAVCKMSSALFSSPMSSTACGVGFIPEEVRTKRGSWKCLRSFAKLMLIADWLRSRFSAVCDTLRVLFSSVTTAKSFRSMFVKPTNAP